MPVIVHVEDYILDLTRVAESVFRTMLGMNATIPDKQPPGRNLVTAAVQFSGEWQGAVLLQCTLADAIDVCKCLMPGCQPTTFDADVRDALGELANMVGGNMKSILPPGVTLSTPLVMEGTDFSVHVRGTKDMRSVRFSGTLGTFEVTLVTVTPL